MTVSLIYAYWPNQPFGATWCDLPWALRDAGLPKRLADASHEVLETVAMSEAAFPEETRSGFDLAGQIAADVAKARAEGELPVILCGSCTVAALAGVAGLGGGEDVGIAWFDAHPNLNTPDTSTSGLLEGMALAIATGQAWNKLATSCAGLAPASLHRTALYGARDIDPPEQRLIDRYQVPIATDASTVNARLHGTATTYVHLDMDVHDAVDVRTTNSAISNGPNVASVRAALTSLERIGAIAVTGLDPAAPDARKATDIAIDHLIAIADARA